MPKTEVIKPILPAEELPEIIQGGMGVAVSNWRLAGEVARHGELGVVSGTAIGVVLARRLQDGDKDSKKILESYFPDQNTAQKIIEKYYIEDGKTTTQKYRNVPMLSHRPSKMAEDLNLAGAFVEVTLAKNSSQGNGKIGINLLAKLEEPTITALYGAMLANVDVVIMGAGIPRHIPNILDDLALKRPTSMPLSVTGATETDSNINYRMHFDPEKRYPELIDEDANRPNFLAIVSINSLATYLAKRENAPNGLVVERWTAGGHNAPPRVSDQFNDRGEPIYGPKDTVDTQKLQKLGLPFWMAGGFGGAKQFIEAKNEHARGIQVGSAFALTQESGMSHQLKLQIVKSIMQGEPVDVYTDPLASPTGFPFKVANVEGTLSDKEVYKNRTRVCDLGYLREKYEKEDGTIGYRCPSEPIDAYEKKGGSYEETVGRMCLCNALMSTVELPQIKNNHNEEPSVVTLGDDASRVVRSIMKSIRKSSERVQEGELYNAEDVLNYIRGTN